METVLKNLKDTIVHTERNIDTYNSYIDFCSKKEWYSELVTTIIEKQKAQILYLLVLEEALKELERPTLRW